MGDLASVADPLVLIPGRPDQIFSAARAWTQLSDAAVGLADRLFAVSVHDAWQGEAADDFSLRRTSAADDWSVVAQVLVECAASLHRYAETLAWAQGRAVDAVDLHRRGLTETLETAAQNPAQGAADTGAALRVRAEELLSEAREVVSTRGEECAAAIEAAARGMSENGRWSAALFFAPAPSIDALAPRAATRRLGISILERLSRADAEQQISELLALHPDWMTLLEQFPPDDDEVRAWWDGIDDPAARSALLAAIPAVLGTLGGLPPLVRVAANRENAADRVAALQRSLDDPHLAPEERAAITAERHYLQRAVDGDVQLYMYDAPAHCIIEMIGTPSTSTTTTITYVPGTFTSMQSFYGGGPQEVVEWMNQQDAGVLGFVWKDGVFPGDEAGAPPSVALAELPLATGLSQANDPDLARAMGDRLAGFAAEIRGASDAVADSESVAMGHSWGLAPITASEVAGAQYDQVHSLAGAGMPEGWAPDPRTTYTHWAYTDVLTMAQETGVVWEGRVPAHEPAFDSHVYARDGDVEIPLPAPPAIGLPGIEPQPTPSFRVSFRALENHQLIASDEVANRDALDDILREVQK